MKVLIQRVTKASIEINERVIKSIGPGLLVFVGIEKLDSQINADKMVRRLLSYRIFADEHGKMNHSVVNIGTDVLLVSQFTLVADTSSGTRPGFSSAKQPNEAKMLYDYFVAQMKANYRRVSSSAFATDMQVSLVNDGPVTFMLRC